MVCEEALQRFLREVERSTNVGIKRLLELLHSDEKHQCI